MQLQPYWLLLASRRLLFGLPCLFIFLTSRGVTSLDISLCLLTLASTQVLCEVPSGVFSDKFGRRNTLFVAGIFRVIGWGSFSLLPSTTEPVLTFWIAVCGFGAMGASFAFDSGTDSAWLYETVKESIGTETYPALEGKAQGIGLVSLGVATLAGGALSNVSLELPIYCTVIAMLVSAAGALLLKEPSAPHPSPDRHFWHQVRVGLHAVWREKFLFQVVVLSALALSICEIYFRFVQQLMQGQLGVDPTAFGFIYATWLLISAAGARSAQYLLQGRRVVVVVRWAVISLGISLMWFGGSTDLSGLLVSAIPQFCFGLLPILVRSELNKVVESEVRATVLSTFGFLISAFVILVAPWIGLMAEWTGEGPAVVLLGFGIVGSATVAHILFSARRWGDRPGWSASLWG